MASLTSRIPDVISQLHQCLQVSIISSQHYPQVSFIFKLAFSSSQHYLSNLLRTISCIVWLLRDNSGRTGTFLAIQKGFTNAELIHDALVWVNKTITRVCIRLLCVIFLYWVSCSTYAAPTRTGQIQTKDLTCWVSMTSPSWQCNAEF